MALSPIEISKNLKGIDLPASKDEVCEHARSHNADEAVISALESMPDQQYQTMADIEHAVQQ